MIVIGGESESDLSDLWAFCFESVQWISPKVNNSNLFQAKRFHTATKIQESKVVTFGGCYGEYVHLNQLNVFDFATFLKDNTAAVECNLVENKSNSPDTRWGHAAVSIGDNLYVLGGRNDQDISDVHCFNMVTNKWKELEISGKQPIPR